MTNKQQPTKLPLDLLQQLVDELAPLGMKTLAAAIVQWGWEQRSAAIEAELQQARDEELEACCEWLATQNKIGLRDWADKLRDARRPKPPSLKEQALEALGYLQEDEPNYQSSFDVIHKALEQLND